LELVIVSDFQIGGRYDDLASIEWPNGLTVRQVTVGSNEDSNDNAFARVLRSKTEFLDPEASEESSETRQSTSQETRVRVSNSQQSRIESFKLAWVDQQGRIIDSSLKEVLIPPGQTRNVSMTVMPDQAISLRLLGDRIEFDNEYFCAPINKQSYRVICLTNLVSADEKSAEFFLQQLPLGSEAYDVDLSIRSLAEDWILDPKLEPCTYVIGLPSGDSLLRLRRYLEQGGSVFWLMDQPVSDALETWQTACRIIER
jgi:hypothetical protein